MTSQTGKQTITTYLLPNISQIKGKHAMKFGQVIEDNKINIFLQKLCTRKLVPHFSQFSKKALPEVKATGLQFSFHIV